MILRGQDVFAWDHAGEWRLASEVEPALVPVARGDLSVEFFVRFEPSPAANEYSAVLVVNNSPVLESFFDIRVKKARRTFRVF